MLTQAQWMLLAVLAQLALAGYELWRIHMGLESRNWPQVTGTLKKIWQEDDTLHDVDDTEGTHSIHARYRYKVGTRWYDGKRVGYGIASGLRFSEALDYLHGRRAGSEVDVYYDPEKPERAVLFPGSSTANAVLLGAWLVGAIITMWSWFSLA